MDGDTLPEPHSAQIVMREALVRSALVPPSALCS
jgi:hypothetical protein